MPGRIRTVHSMTEMMTRFLAMGFTLDRVVEMCTINPARAIGEEDRLGSLTVGKQADVSVLDIEDGGKSERAVVPVMSVKRGEVFEAGWGPRPWGWTPDSA